MASSPHARIRAWRFVITFGFVSLLSDFVYEGARSITGPLLAHFGATALVVGIVTGIGEAAALMLRLVSGPLVDRTKRFWAWVIAGYALTVVSVPTLGLSGTLWVACGLVIVERVGKAVRSPAKDALLSYATAGIGRGRGFAVQEALHQVGAIIGPLVVALMLIVTGGNYAPSLAVLAVPGVAALALLVWLWVRVPNPVDYEPAELRPVEHADAPASTSRRLPRAFWAYSGFTALTMVGFATFGMLSFHMVERDIIPATLVPVLYAGVMAVDGLVALGTGWAYDRFGPHVLLLLPIIQGEIPVTPRDAEMLRLLADAGRMPNVELTSALEMPSSTSLTRLNALRESGVIRGFHTSVDRKALGLRLDVMIGIDLAEQTVDVIRSVSAKVRELRQVVAILEMAGNDTPLILQAYAVDTDDLQLNVIEPLTRIPGIVGTHSNIVFDHMRRLSWFGDFQKQ